MRLGFAPITWNNEDLRAELAPAVPYTTVLDEVAACGYSGTELGDGFPRDARTLRRALEERDLCLVSAWCGLSLEHREADDLRHVRELAGLLSAVGAQYLNLADQGSPASKAWAGCCGDLAAPRLSPAEWDGFAERVCKAAEIAREHGLQATFHAHVGTCVETLADLEALLARAPVPLLKLVLDVGHALFGGMDPVSVIRKHPDRIAYVHLKDVNGDVLDTVRRERLGCDEAIRRRVFTELGHGLLDVGGVLAALGDMDYSGWLMVEQDSTWLSPSESARVSRTYLTTLGV